MSERKGAGLEETARAAAGIGGGAERRGGKLDCGSAGGGADVRAGGGAAWRGSGGGALLAIGGGALFAIGEGTLIASGALFGIGGPLGAGSRGGSGKRCVGSRDGMRLAGGLEGRLADGRGGVAKRCVGSREGRRAGDSAAGGGVAGGSVVGGRLARGSPTGSADLGAADLGAAGRGTPIEGIVSPVIAGMERKTDCAPALGRGRPPSFCVGSRDRRGRGRGVISSSGAGTRRDPNQERCPCRSAFVLGGARRAGARPAPARSPACSSRATLGRVPGAQKICRR